MRLILRCLLSPICGGLAQESSRLQCVNSVADAAKMGLRADVAGEVR